MGTNCSQHEAQQHTEGEGVAARTVLADLQQSTVKPVEAVVAQTVLADGPSIIGKPAAPAPAATAEAGGSQPAEPAVPAEAGGGQAAAAERARGAEPLAAEGPAAATTTPYGSIQDVLNAPLRDVPWDSSWFSIFLMWLTLPLSLLQGIFCGLMPCLLVAISIGYCCGCCTKFNSAMGSVLMGRPLYTAFIWWRYLIAALTALIYNGKSRLGLFMYEWKAFGSGDHWWHGEGLWTWRYADCDRIMKSHQNRHSAFGAIKACTPDLFASDILIFLPNDGTADSNWASIRQAMHSLFLNETGLDFLQRVAQLPAKLASNWPSPRFNQLDDVALLQKMVSKCVLFVMFGVWVEDKDAEVLMGWRTNALQFILPRLAHRFLFNLGIRKVKSLRANTVSITEKYGLQGVFEQMNNDLPAKWRRPSVVKLVDEIMYVVGFAGIGGTCAAVESCAAFLQNKIPEESAAKHILFGTFDTPAKMVARYLSEPETYIKETLRMVPPVTSATAVLQEATKVVLAGKEFNLPAGLLNQYVLSMANRDSSVFDTPEVFNPDRPNLNKAFTWNGCFGAINEADYPRICPGRHLSLHVVKAVLGHFVNTSVHARPAANSA